jgi:hypothetical protein
MLLGGSKDHCGAAILWGGASLFKPSEQILVVGVALAPKGNGANGKTGDVIQCWIIPRDRDPTEECCDHRGPSSICGDCALRRPRTCYVNPGMARAIWVSCQEGGIDVFPSWPALEQLLEGRVVRLGAYGDPAAVPTFVWKSLVEMADGHLGYTQAWRLERAQDLQPYCMASVHSREERAEARSRGWRTFRIRLPSEELDTGEVKCAGSEEGGREQQCITCLRCAGTSGRHRQDVAIFPHGSGKQSFRRVRFNAQQIQLL